MVYFAADGDDNPLVRYLNSVKSSLPSQGGSFEELMRILSMGRARSSISEIPGMGRPEPRITGTPVISEPTIPMDGAEGWRGRIEGFGRDEISTPSISPRPPGARLSQLDAIFQQLLNSIGSNAGTAADYEEMLRDSEESIRSAYGGQIGSLQGQNQRTKKEQSRNAKEIDQMYNALSKSYRRAGQRENRATKRQVRTLEGIGDTARDQMRSGANQRISSQAKLLANLGVGEAADSVLTPQNARISDDLASMVRQTARDKSFAVRQGGANRRFYNRGATGAQLEGTNAQADLYEQMQDILAGNRDQISALRGQQGMDITNARNEILASQAATQQDAASEAFNQLMALAQLKLDIEAQQFGQGLDRQDQQLQLLDLMGDQTQSSELGGISQFMPTNYTDAAQIIQQLGPAAPEGMAILKSLMESNALTQGEYTRTNPETRLDTTYQTNPNYAALLMGKFAEQSGVNFTPEQIELLKQAALAYAS